MTKNEQIFADAIMEQITAYTKALIKEASGEDDLSVFSDDFNMGVVLAATELTSRICTVAGEFAEAEVADFCRDNLEDIEDEEDDWEEGLPWDDVEDDDEEDDDEDDQGALTTEDEVAMLLEDNARALARIIIDVLNL